MQNRLSMIALFLWLTTIAVFGWFFVHGNTAMGTDGRTSILLSPGERDFILGEMRGLLSGTRDIMEGLDRGDLKAAAKAARSIGTAAAADVNPTLMTKLPLDFKTLGMSVHGDMDKLAMAAESGKSPAELRAMLTSTMSKCVACHASWRLDASRQGNLAGK